MSVLSKSSGQEVFVSFLAVLLMATVFIDSSPEDIFAEFVVITQLNAFNMQKREMKPSFCFHIINYIHLSHFKCS